MIPVTKPFLPPRENFDEYISDIWKRNWLTNNGPNASDLELRLKEYLNVTHLLFVTNGTIALQMAIRALNLKGEVITTPFSYVATSSSIVWEECTPVYVDIDPKTLNLNAELIERSISERTSAIIATHCFGNPCEIEKIEAIALKYKLKVIYDAAHCFHVSYRNTSVLDFGDISTISFHATKIFHTVEGGAVVTKEPELLKSMASMRNFGHKSFIDFHGLGINGKNSEFHAAMGLAVLPYMDRIIERRKNLSERYLGWQEEIGYEIPEWNQFASKNYSYFPVIFKTASVTTKVYEGLKANEVFARRYFYPTLNKLPYLNGESCPISEDISNRILCLPLYHDLTNQDIDMIARMIIRIVKYD